MKYPIYKVRNNAYHYLALLRRLYLRRRYGMDIGPNTRISRSARIDKTNPKGVHIGANTSISYEVAILTHDFVNRRHVDTYIGSNCFIGGRSTILPGVTIGDHCIIGAGSVVMNDIPSNTVAAGNPARLIRSGIMTEEYGILKEEALERSAEFGKVSLVHGREAPEDTDIYAFIKSETGVDDDAMQMPVANTSVDSFALISLRSALEARFSVSIPDLEWVGAQSLAEIVRLPSLAGKGVAKTASSSQTGAPDRPATGAIDPPPPPPSIPEDRFTQVTHQLPPGKPASMVESRSPGRIHRRHIIEMSKMALSGMGEPWLFRELNDLHWTLICDFLQTASSQVSDGKGDRLYATITRCAINFEPCLTGFKENTPLDIHSRLERYGSSVFFSRNSFESSAGAKGEAVLMSTFAKYGERGNNKSLIKGAPPIPDPNSVPSMDPISDFGRDYRVRRSEEPYDKILFETEYEILGPHDINGVGLLYFAAYPTIFDICIERSEEKGFLRKFSTVSKDIMYFANSEPEETLIFRVHGRETEGTDLIHHVCSLSRKSDGARMAELKGTKRRTLRS
jgi:probable biosynthetic protein (TIGR04098 family)